MNTRLLKIIVVALMLCLVTPLFSGCKKASKLSVSNEPLKNNTEITINAQGLQKPYKSLKELITKTDTIFIGKVISVEESQMIDLNKLATESEMPSDKGAIPPTYHVHTVSNVEVIEVIKGNLNVGDIVDVKQDSGTCGNIKKIYDDTKYYNIGDEYVFFTYHFIPSTSQEINVIKRELYIPATSYEGQIQIINDNFILDNERLVKLFSKRLEKELKNNEKIKKDDTIQLIKEDLKNNTNYEQTQEE